jgi:hypothetical protein
MINILKTGISLYSPLIHSKISEHIQIIFASSTMNMETHFQGLDIVNMN